ncbi:unnamed protein product, partial [Heterosigma akashiwo]
CKRQIVYDLTKEQRVTEEQRELLSLGLNFGIAPKRVPLVEYIAAVESVVQQLEGSGDVEAIKTATDIKAIALEELRRAVGLQIRSTLTPGEKEVLRGLRDDNDILIVPADKGRAVVVMDRETYLQKMQDQLLSDDYVEMPAEEVAAGGEKKLLDGLHAKLVEKLKEMGVDTRGGYYLTMTAPEMAKLYLLIKVHKDGYPGRPVVSQIDDPTYNICKVLTDILNPLKGGVPSSKNSFELKKMLKGVRLSGNSRLVSFDVKALYPSIPMKKAFEVVRQKLEEDETLPERTPWSPAQIVELLEICLETHF